MTPIFKKGKKSDPNNYRPVSLTSTVCKIMETIIRDEIVKHVENQKLLSPAQHGFRSNRSCSTQLIEVIHDWANSLDENTPVDSYIWITERRLTVSDLKDFWQNCTHFELEARYIDG